MKNLLTHDVIHNSTLLKIDDSFRKSIGINQSIHIAHAVQFENEFRKIEIAIPDFLPNNLASKNLDTLGGINDAIKKATQFNISNFIKMGNNFPIMKSKSFELPNYVQDSLLFLQDTESKIKTLNLANYELDFLKNFESFRATKNLTTHYISLNNVSDILGKNILFNEDINILNAVKEIEKLKNLCFPNYIADAIKILHEINSIYCVDENGNVLIDENTDVESLLAQVGDFFEKITDTIIDTKSWALKQSRPIKFLMALFIISGVLINTIMYGAKMYEYFLQENSNLKQRELIREIIKEEKFLDSDLRDYKFVSKNILNVRKFGNKKSEIIDNILFGKKVKIVEKLKDWSLIEYQDSDILKVKQGWVFSRYLHKFD